MLIFPDNAIVPIGLTIDKINRILDSLRKLPWEDSNELIVDLTNQANQQIRQYIENQTALQDSSQKQSESILSGVPQEGEPIPSDK